MGCVRTSSTFPTPSRKQLMNMKEFCTLKSITKKNVLVRQWTQPCPNLFITKSMKLLSRPDTLKLFGKSNVYFLSTSELLYPKMKTRLWPIEARPKINLISDIPKVSLAKVDCFTFVILLSRLIITIKEKTCWLKFLGSSKNWRL